MRTENRLLPPLFRAIAPWCNLFSIQSEYVTLRHPNENQYYPKSTKENHWCRNDVQRYSPNNFLSKKFAPVFSWLIYSTALRQALRILTMRTVIASGIRTPKAYSTVAPVIVGWIVPLLTSTSILAWVTVARACSDGQCELNKINPRTTQFCAYKIRYFVEIHCIYTKYKNWGCASSGGKSLFFVKLVNPMRERLNFNECFTWQGTSINLNDTCTIIIVQIILDTTFTESNVFYI